MLPVRICAGGAGTTGVPTATGQHREDEVNGPSGRVNVKRKEVAIKSKSTKRCCANTRVCSGKAKTITKRS